VAYRGVRPAAKSLLDDPAPVGLSDTDPVILLDRVPMGLEAAKSAVIDTLGETTVRRLTLTRAPKRFPRDNSQSSAALALCFRVSRTRPSLSDNVRGEMPA
jgi:hypothetical protein